MWNDLHRELAGQLHAERLREAEAERLAHAVRPARRRFRLRLGRLELRWNCPPPREATGRG